MSRENPKKKPEIQDALRLASKEAAAILRQMDETAEQFEGIDRRQAPRQSYQEVPRLAVSLEDEPVGLRSYAMIPRNISRTGISLLHGQFVYDGTVCIVCLKRLSGELVNVRGRVARCRLVSGRVHELGVHFDEPIEVSDFLARDQAA